MMSVFSIIAPIILVFCAIGAYTVHNSTFDIVLMMVFGVAGYMALAGLGLIALSYVPLLGYVEVVAIALLAARVRRRDTKRFAGLRTLAK